MNSPSWYASKTKVKRGLDSGWVDAKSRSRTYKSTALSSTKFEQTKIYQYLYGQHSQIVLERQRKGAVQAMCSLCGG